MTGRDRTVIVIVLSIAAVAAAWMLLIQPKRSQAGRLGAQITTEQRQLQAQETEVAAGEQARREYSSYYNELSRLGEAVPSGDDVPALIYQLQGAARRSGIDFRSLVLSSGGAAPAATTPATGAAATSTAALPPGVVIGTAGLPEEPFTLSFNGSFFHLAAFLGRIQRFVRATDNAVSVSGRLMTVNSVSFSPGPAGFPQITTTLDVTTYLVPGALTKGSLSAPATTTTVPTTGSDSTPAAIPSAVIPAVR
jgi:hypothetical protein